MKKAGIALLILSSLSLSNVVFSATTGEEASSEKQSTTHCKANFDFILSATKASITKVDSNYELTLSGTSETSFYITRACDKKNSGIISTTELMKKFEKTGGSFQTEHPNGAIVANGLNPSVAVELSNPKTVDDHTFKFTIKDLDGKLSEGTYENVHLFIDPLSFGSL